MLSVIKDIGILTYEVASYASQQHGHENAVILKKLLSLAALEVVFLTIFRTASDENFIQMMTFSFQ